ncbi:hypothetical protein Q31b_08090 [Novipirellula aureliae]|uniref:Uncharacterized protein n=2 Tax=Novipirellula aureliae TaxID=2527966 RepID=A0A5C6E7L3_9BACT|nr:hypothetical protein Q31b_08090 [Novipirellula aureliae]
MYHRAKRFSLVCTIFAASSATLAMPTVAPAQQSYAQQGYAQQSYAQQGFSQPQPGTLRPVPQMGHEQPSRTAENRTHDPQRDGWDLKWRKSSSVTPPASRESVEQRFAQEDPFAEDSRLRAQPSTAPQIVAHGTMQVGHLQVAASEPDLARLNSHASNRTAKTALVAYPQADGGFQLPAPNPSAPQQAAPVQAETPDFFENPFGSVDQATPSQPAAPRSTDGGANNGLRSVEPIEPLPPPSSPALNSPPDHSFSKPYDGPSLGDMLREDPPKAEEPPRRDFDESVESLPDPRGERVESPSDRPGPFENPFNRDRDAEVSEHERVESLSEDSIGDYRGGQDELKKDLGLTCEEFRNRIASQTIDKVSLDISPPFRPDVISETEYEKLKSKFDENQDDRQWRSIEGRPLAAGRLVDLAYEKAVIETAYGTTEELSINRLSEPDLAYISENWGLPKECLVEQVAYTPRRWQKTTMTWKASNLCHKPLYFEDVNLERYGHTRGPLWQPVVSSAHFFANIAVLPYKMGVHTPGECQYALGYYRPGNCAPWIKPPVPISLRGGLTQAAVMTGAFWLIP